MPHQATRWAQSFLQDRKMYMAFNGTKQQPTPLNSRLPQGSPLSPVYFITNTQVMLEEPPSIPLTAVSYINNDTLGEENSSREQNIQQQTTHWENRTTREKILNLQYDTSKSALLHILQEYKGNIQNPTYPPSIYPNSRDLVEPEPFIKHLGILVDEKLNFIQYSNQAVSKGRQTLAISSVL